MATKRNRKPITDPHILELIQECVTTVQNIGFSLPENLKFQQCKADRRAGLANYTDVAVVLSNFLFQESDKSIKAVIYHELAHHIAGPGTHHGPVWQSVVKTISKAIGCRITRTYSLLKDMPNHAKKMLKKISEQPKTVWRFHCSRCGAKLRPYRRMTPFVKTYNEILPNGQPHWTCRACGGMFVMDDPQ